MDGTIKELFNYFEKQTKIQIPQNVQEYYLNGDNYNSQFIRLFKSQIDSVKRGDYPYLSVLISEKLAKEILKLVYEFSYDERITTLFQKVLNYNNYKKDIKFDTSVEDFVIEEILYSTIDYNYKEDKFDFPLIQKAYENINSNHQELKVVLILWADCGGEGAIIVRGKNTGYDTGYPHSESTEIVFNEKTYEYRGFLFENYEKLHKPIIENFK